MTSKRCDFGLYATAGSPAIGYGPVPGMFGSFVNDVVLPPSELEADIEAVPVPAHIGLPPEPLAAPSGRLRVRTRLDEVVPANDLAADEAAGHVGVDGCGRVQRGL